SKIYGGKKSDDLRNSILTKQYEIISVGRSNSSDGDVSGNKGANDMWVTKTDIAGNLLWKTSLGGSKDEDAFSVVELPGSLYLVGGSYKSNGGDFGGIVGSAEEVGMAVL